MERLSLEQQVEWFDREADAALAEIRAHLSEFGEVVKRRARLRLASIGAEDYGDDSWHLPDEQLMVEWLDEAADQLVYGVMRRRLATLGLDTALTTHSRGD